MGGSDGVSLLFLSSSTNDVKEQGRSNCKLTSGCVAVPAGFYAPADFVPDTFSSSEPTMTLSHGLE